MDPKVSNDCLQQIMYARKYLQASVSKMRIVVKKNPQPLSHY